MPVKDYPITEKMKTSIIIDKPESKSQVQAQRGKEEIGLRANTKILWATTTPPTHPPITFKHEGGL